MSLQKLRMAIYYLAAALFIAMATVLALGVGYPVAFFYYLRERGRDPYSMPTRASRKYAHIGFSKLDNC